MQVEYSDNVRTLRSADVVALRVVKLSDPHMAPLRDFVETRRKAQPDLEFPDFDPCDGGLAADILFLFEKPGPMTSKNRNGSGFISRNNDDPTAEATFRFMKIANLPRERTIIWNVVPGWNGSRKITASELSAGVDDLKELLLLLTNLRTIVLVGQKAQRAISLVEPLGLRIVTSAHPSPLVRARYPAVWNAIPSSWALAGRAPTPV